MPRCAQKQKTIQNGFTIVELLVVVVIIAVLAAITIVAYNGITKQAHQSALLSLGKQAKTKVELYKVGAGNYPVSINDCPNPTSTSICSGLDSANVSYKISPFSRSTGYHMVISPGFEVTYKNDRSFIYESNAEVTGNREFLQYTDFAPIINQYGLRPYRLSFSIKSADVSVASTARVYFQNGSDSRHFITEKIVPVTTEYSRKEVIFTPVLANASLDASYIAFFGIYDTGNKLTVKDVRLELAN